mgnify:CR=1 FL=1
MSTIYTLAQKAIDLGYTHVKAADGTLTSLDTVASKSISVPRVNGWSFVDWPPKIALFSQYNHTLLGYYEVVTCAP